MQTVAADRGVGVAGVVADDHSGLSGVSWSAIIAGAAGAAALSYILVILGFGLGLSSVSPWTNEGVAASTFGIATAAWLAFTQIAAAAMGGYLAGRLRVKWGGVHTDEVYFRDTAHGFLSWALASLVVAAFLGTTLAAVLGGGASVAGSALAGAGAAAAPAVDRAASNASGPTSYFVDTMFRTPAAPVADGSAGTRDSGAMTGEASRIVLNDLSTGALTPADKTYLGQLVAQRTGVDQQQAEARVDNAFTQAKAARDEAVTKAKQTADDARKAAAHAALWAFIALLAGAFFASLAATVGGRQRDAVVYVTTHPIR
jgi:hypothetical protein